MNGHFGNKSRSAKRLLRILTAVCAIALAAVLWRIWSRPDVPPLDPVLLERAQALPADRVADEEGEKQMRRILDSASDAASSERKEDRLAALAREFAGQGHFGAACQAALHVSHAYKRDGLLAEIARDAAAACDTLPWGARAVKNMQGRGVKIDAVLLLNARLRQCAKETAGQPASEAISPPARRFGQEGQPKP